MPLDYADVGKKALKTLHEAGHLEGNLVGIDPYTGGRNRPGLSDS